MLEALAGLPARAAPARRRRLARAAHAAHQPAHQHRGAGAGRPLPPEDRERLLADVLAQLDELTVLVTDLVDLARGDEHASVAEDVRLDMLVGEAVERARRHALDRRFETTSSPASSGACRRGSTGRSATCSTTRPSGARPEAGSSCASPDGEVQRARPRARHLGGRPAVRLRPLLPRPRRARPAGLGPRAWRSCVRSPRRTAARCMPSSRRTAARCSCCGCPCWPTTASSRLQPRHARRPARWSLCWPP